MFYYNFEKSIFLQCTHNISFKIVETPLSAQSVLPLLMSHWTNMFSCCHIKSKPHAFARLESLSRVSHSLLIYRLSPLFIQRLTFSTPSSPLPLSPPPPVAVSDAA